MFATDKIVGLAEWIIDDTCLVSLSVHHKVLNLLIHGKFVLRF